MDGDAANLAVDLLTLAGVDPGPDVEAELLDSRRNRGRAAQRLRRLSERHEEAVAGRVLLAPVVPPQLPPDDVPEPSEDSPPAGIA
jgi:hypothetical protein